MTLRTADPLPVEDYRPGGAVGSFLIIDPADGTTLAAGMVGDRRAALHPSRISSAAISSSAAPTEEDFSMTCPSHAHRMTVDRCPRPAVHGRDIALSPANLPTPGP